MEKTLLQRYIAGVRDTQHGESYSTLLQFFLPEFITALILSSILHIIDAAFIAQIKSTSMYATLGVTSTLIHLITKIAEGLSVGTLVICGQYNGIAHYKKVGRAAVSGIYLTIAFGFGIALLIFFGAPTIYGWYKVSDKMLALGVTFLRLRAVSIFLSFIFFACIGYLRSIKNTQVPMTLFVLGGIIFIVSDYICIFGKCGLPAMKLFGSAVASIIQYFVMVVGALYYILFSPQQQKYAIRSQSFDHESARSIIMISWPVMLDKAILAAAKMWLALLISPLGKTALASFAVIKDMEQLAFVPAIACAQVITFLVSNDYSRRDWIAIKNNIKRIILLASFIVGSIVCLFSYCPEMLIQFFDTKKVFGSFAAQAFPLLSVLVFFDLLQLILAGALRGASDVKTVMLVRLVVCVGFFCPFSYMISHLAITNVLYKFVLLYGSFYVSNGLMSLYYIYRLHGHQWKTLSDIKPSRIVHDQDYQGRSSEISRDVQHTSL